MRDLLRFGQGGCQRRKFGVPVRQCCSERITKWQILLLLSLVLSPWTRNALAQRPELLYLRFNAGSGLTVNDQAIPGLPGTSMVMQNGVSWDSFDPRIGASSLNTATAGPNPVALCYTNSVVQYSGDWTIETWVKKVTPTGFPGQSHIFGAVQSTSPCLALPNVSNADLVFLSCLNGDDVYIKGAGLQGIWQHLAIVHDASEMTLTPYLDGVAGTSVVQNAPVDLIGDGAGGLLIGGRGDSPWQGRIDEFRIWGHTRSQAQIVAHMNTQVNAEIDDAAVTSIQAPVRLPRNYVPFTAAETVTVRVANFGTNSILSGTNVPVSFRVDEGPIVTEMIVLSADLTTGGSVGYTFTSTADLSGPGTHCIEAWAELPIDLNPANNSKTRSYGGSEGHFVTEFPYLETFDSVAFDGAGAPSTWYQDTNDGPADWAFTNNPATNFLTINEDHTTGINGEGFVAFVGSAFPAPNVSLLSPIFDLGTNTNPRLDFWIYNFDPNPGLADNTLSVDVILQPSGTVVPDVLGPVGATGPAWTNLAVNLSAFQGQVVQLRIRVDSSQSMLPHFIAVDDVRLTDHPVGPGQPPQPGLAVMEINHSISPGGLDLSFLENGPYSAQATPGGPFNFHFEGEADQPIILMFGSYNPVVATYPNTGQFDIGGSLDLATGIPTNLFLLFDGTSATGLNPLFRTSVFGISDLVFLTPVLPPGYLTTFQSAIFNTVFGVSLSNAVHVEIL